MINDIYDSNFIKYFEELQKDEKFMENYQNSFYVASSPISNYNLRKLNDELPSIENNINNLNSTSNSTINFDPITNSTTSNPTETIDDSILSNKEEDFFFKEPYYYNFFFDLHLYNWQEPYTYISSEEHIKNAQQYEILIKKLRKNFPIVIGEWSMSTGTFLQGIIFTHHLINLLFLLFFLLFLYFFFLF